MTTNKSNIRCETPKCINTIKKHGEQYHRVYDTYVHTPDFMPDAIARCENCGGYTNGIIWKHVCNTCGKEVEPGKLVGLFVPHLCQECLNEAIERDMQSGNVCTVCHQPRSLCCC